MNFLNPLFLIGLFAVAIPVVLHFINLRRPQKVSFSNLSFFNELQQTTIRRIRIRQYILMALRALAVLLMAAALARPFLPPTLTGSAGSGEPTSITVIVDNSPSMSRIGSQGPLMEQGKQMAERIVEHSQSEDRFLIFQTNGRNDSPGLVNAAKAEQLIQDIEVENTGHYSHEVLQRAYSQLQASPQTKGVIYLISDAQKSQYEDLENITLNQSVSEGGKEIAFQLINLEQPRQQNLAIISLDLTNQMISRQSPLKLAVEVQNTGKAAAANQYVSLEVEGEIKGQYEVNLQPGDKQELSFNINPGEAGEVIGRVIIEGDEIGFDNNHYFALRIPEQRRTLVIHDENENSSFSSFLAPVLDAAQNANSQLSFSREKLNDINPSQLTQYDAIVFDGLPKIPDYLFGDLQRYVQNGGGVVFYPSEEGEVASYNKFFSLFNGGRYEGVIGSYASFDAVEQLADLQEGHEIINNLFLLEEEETINVDEPSLFYYYYYQPPENSEALTILQAANGDPLLSEQNFGEGKLLISSVGTDPGWSNFPVNPLFAPVSYRTILYASSTEYGGLQLHQLGEPFVWEGRSSYSEALLRINDIEAKPDVQQKANRTSVTHTTYDWEPGWLTLETADKSFKVGINQHVMESRFAALEQEGWQESLESSFSSIAVLNADNFSANQLREAMNSAVFGREIWNWFIVLALILLITESLVSRLYTGET